MQSNLEKIEDSYALRFQGSPEDRKRLDALTREPSPPTVSSFRTRAVIAAVTVLGICYFFPATIAYFVVAATAFGVYKGVNHLRNPSLSEGYSSASTEPDDAVVESYNSTAAIFVQLNNNNLGLPTNNQVQGPINMSSDTDHEPLLGASESYNQEDNNNHASREVGIIVDNAREQESDDAADVSMESRSSRASSLG